MGIPDSAFGRVHPTLLRPRLQKDLSTDPGMAYSPAGPAQGWGPRRRLLHGNFAAHSLPEAFAIKPNGLPGISGRPPFSDKQRELVSGKI